MKSSIEQTTAIEKLLTVQWEIFPVTQNTSRLSPNSITIAVFGFPYDKQWDIILSHFDVYVP